MTWLGWCPGGRTTKTMLDTYQGTGCARIFVSPGKPIPTWDSPVLGPLVAAGVPVVHLSVKDRDWPAVKRLVDGKPAGMLLILTVGHEPEQGPEEGDLPIDQWKQAWADLVALLAGHPARGELLLAPVYTRYWWEKNRGDLRWLLDLPVDAIGWDIYNNGAGYRTPDDLLTIPRQIAEKTGLPYLVGELGALPLPSDKDGAGRDAWMRAMVDAIRGDGALTCCWFHKDGWDLLSAGSEPAQKTWQTLIVEEAAMTWRKGQPWRTVRSLDRLNEQIRAAAPKAVPPATPAASWGSIADSAHSTSSDHYPHVYSALGSTAVVCARDFPHAPTLGLDAHKIAEQLRLSRDPRIGYIISNGRITGPNYGWRWSAYNGSDPHDTHIHVSTVHTAAADSGADWQIGDDDMPLTSDDIERVATATKQKVLSDGGIQLLLTRVYQQGVTLAAVQTALGKLPTLIGAEGTNPAELKALLDALPKPGGVDEQAIVAGVLAGLPADKIAEAIPAQLARDVADELSRRLTS